MADGLNKVMLLGNLGAEPELRITPGGQAVLKLRMATNESYLDKNNVRQERVEWHRVTIWGRRAEALGKILNKGDSLFVEGRIQTSSYEKNGEKRYSTEIVADEVILCGGRGGNSERHSERPAHRGGLKPADDGSFDIEPPADPPAGNAGSGGSGGSGDDDIPFTFAGDAPWQPPRWERW